eukprot:gene20914-27760_t
MASQDCNATDGKSKNCQVTVAAELSRVAPIKLLRLGSIIPWRGGFLSLQGVVERLREVLPPTFEDLDKEFALGVVGRDGVHRVIDSGALPEAVAASAAIPFLNDGDKVKEDESQLGLPRCILHVISSGTGSVEKTGEPNITVVQMNKSGFSLVHLGDLDPNQTKPNPLIVADSVDKTGELNIKVVKSTKSRISLFHLGDPI